MSKYVIEDTTLTEIADAIRSKTGSTGKLTPSAMSDKIAEIDTSTTPEITVSSTGLITATSGSKSATKQLTNRTASDLSVSGKKVTAPAGYYNADVSKEVASTTQATPSISVDSAGKITASATQTAGYVDAGTKSATKQLTTQAAKTVTPSTSEQTAVASGVYTTGAVKVAAMPTATQATPSITVDSNGKITASATQTAGYVSTGTKSATKQLTTQAAKEITPGTTDQAAVAKNVYTTGAVTVKGDANLIAENIKSGVSIFGVTGNMTGGGETATLTFNKLPSNYAFVTAEGTFYSPTTKAATTGSSYQIPKNSLVYLEGTGFGTVMSEVLYTLQVGTNKTLYSVGVQLTVTAGAAGGLV